MAAMGPSRLELSKPVIAAVAGPAVAGGMELALWCDIRVMEETAFMGVYCRRWGIPLIDGGTVRLPRLVGEGRAMDLILTGRRVDADEALRIGLCEYVVPEGDARAKAEALAHDIARFPKAACARIGDPCGPSTGFRCATHCGRNGGAARPRSPKVSKAPPGLPAAKAVGAISTMYDLALTTSLAPAQSDMETREITIGALLREVAAARPDAEALVEVRQDGSKGRRWTYAELLARRRAAGHGALHPFRPGERIVVWSPNSPEWVLMEYACALSGLVLVTANPAFQARELAYVLEQSGAVALFLVEEFRGNPMGQIGAEVAKGIEGIREITDMNS